MKAFKRIKLSLIALFAVVFVSTFCAFVVTGAKNVNAEETDPVIFAMDDTGLTLRTNNQVGLRFKVKMSESLGQKIKTTEGTSLSFLIAPRAAFDIVKGDCNALFSAANGATGETRPARIQAAEKGKIYEEGGYSWASLVIVTGEANRTLDMSVVAYYTENGTNTYATTDVEKVRGNLYDVVNKTVLSEAKVAKDIIGNEEFGWYGTGNYPIEITTTAQAEVLKASGADISGKTVLAQSSVEVPAEIEASVKKVAENDLGEERAEIKLGETDDYDVDMGSLEGTVVKAAIGGKVVPYADGKVTLNFDFKNRLVKHGEQTLTVTAEKDGTYTNYNKKILIVTKEISTIEELTTVSGRIYGYYRLANNLLNTSNKINVAGSGDWKNTDGQSGFRGTFDGNNKTISGWSTINGMFGIVGEGAVIKNLTYTLTSYEKYGNALARSITGATVENVTINVTNVKPSASINEEGGVITGLMSKGSTYRNVKVNAEGLELDSLFGRSYGWDQGVKNTFTDCEVEAKSLAGLMMSSSIIPATGIEGLKIRECVELSNKNEIVLSGGTEYALDLGEYAGATIESATFAGESVTIANDKLTVSDAFKANKQKHGNQTLSIKAEKDGKYYHITANVLVVTKDISTIDELKAATTAGADNVVYGYYRLTQNVGSSGAWINVENKGDWKNADGSIGFRGTLDGNGFAVDGAFATHGLFGIIGNGAVVKNITFNVYYYQNGRGTLASSITGATIEDVTINIKSITGTLDATAEGGVITRLMSCSSIYRRVTINAEGKDLDTLFGKSYGRYKANKANTFEGCVVNAKSLAGLVHSGDVIPATGITGLTIPE